IHAVLRFSILATDEGIKDISLASERTYKIDHLASPQKREIEANYARTVQLSILTALVDLADRMNVARKTFALAVHVAEGKVSHVKVIEDSRLSMLSI